MWWKTSQMIDARRTRDEWTRMLTNARRMRHDSSFSSLHSSILFLYSWQRKCFYVIDFPIFHFTDIGCVICPQQCLREALNDLSLVQNGHTFTRQDLAQDSKLQNHVVDMHLERTDTTCSPMEASRWHSRRLIILRPPDNILFVVSSYMLHI